MTRRRILNVTTKKKRDTMPAFAAVGSSVTQGPLNLGAGSSLNASWGAHVVAWVATARDLDNSGGGGLPAQDATRTSTTCFMRGLSETMRVSTNTSLPWEWRRLCFTFKGPQLYTASSGARVPLWQEVNPNGWVRLAFALTASASTADQLSVAQNLVSQCFEGTYGVDYYDVFTARPNNVLLKVKYDRTVRVGSPNNGGTQNVFKLWHPMNHNLVYDDIENGGIKTEATLSTDGRPGMGDYYIIDLFRPHPSATNADVIQIQPQATLYWHEK